MALVLLSREGAETRSEAWIVDAWVGAVGLVRDGERKKMAVEFVFLV